MSACLSAAPELSDPDWSPSDVPPELPPEPLPELLDPPAPETPALETMVDLDTPVALTLRFWALMERSTLALEESRNTETEKAPPTPTESPAAAASAFMVRVTKFFVVTETSPDEMISLPFPIVAST